MGRVWSLAALRLSLVCNCSRYLATNDDPLLPSQQPVLTPVCDSTRKKKKRRKERKR